MNEMNRHNHIPTKKIDFNFNVLQNMGLRRELAGGVKQI